MFLRLCNTHDFHACGMTNKTLSLFESFEQFSKIGTSNGGNIKAVPVIPYFDKSTIRKGLLGNFWDKARIEFLLVSLKAK